MYPQPAFIKEVNMHASWTALRLYQSWWLISILVNIMRFYTSHFSDYFCLCLAHKWPSTYHCNIVFNRWIPLQAQQGVYSLGQMWGPAFLLIFFFYVPGSKTTRCLVIGYFLFILTYSFGVDQLQAQQGVYSLGRQWNPAFFLFLPFFG